MAPTTRSTLPKRGGIGGKIEGGTSGTSSVAKRAARKTALPNKADATHKRNAKPLPTVDEIRAAIRPEGTSVGDLMKHFEVQPEDHSDMTKLLASINLPASPPTTAKLKTGEKSPNNATGLFKPGFRPAVDDLYEQSPAEIRFGRRNTLFPASPRNASSAGGNFQYSSPRRSIFGGTPPASATSPLAREVRTDGHRASIFERMATTSGASPSRATSGAGNFQDPSPRRSEFGRMASVSGTSPTKTGQLSSPRRSIFGKIPPMTGSPRIPGTPQSLLPPSQSQPAKITVSASTKQEAEGVLARQQLVRESLFELRGIITNLDWKVQQFEALVDKAEKDVVWDTGSIVETDQEGVRSRKKLRFSSAANE